MKKKQSYILTVIVFVCYLSTQAQSTPEAFLSRLPTIPTVACAADTSVVNRFTDKIYKVKSDLKEFIDRIHADAQADMKKNKNKIVSNAIGQSGLSENDVQELQKSDGNEEQGREAAEKVISEQYGVSMQDLDKLGDMSEEEQEKWAQNYATHQKLKENRNHQGTTKKQEKSARLFELFKEQKTISEQITHEMEKVSQLFKNVAEQDIIETYKLNEKLSPLENQLCSGICTDAEIARSNAAEKQIYGLKVKFCEKMSPLQTNAIEQYLTSLKTLLPIYRQLADVQNKISELQQIGDIVPRDLSCFAAIDEYANTLLVAYKYWVGKFEQ